MLSRVNIAHSFKELNLWLRGRADSSFTSHKGSWEKWNASELATFRAYSVISKIGM